MYKDGSKYPIAKSGIIGRNSNSRSIKLCSKLPDVDLMTSQSLEETFLIRQNNESLQVDTVTSSFNDANT